MKRKGSANDPLWYKDAIIYETHVKAFFDHNGDGIGDFRGLTEKLDYLQALGVTCLWVLPFFPSPLRDDGYDIADYTGVHPGYGTLEDCKAFIEAAHERRMQVLIELVINHTSDAHPWFQAARLAPPGSRQRDYYVWSDTDQKYRDARIIFTDTEKSNWAWDPDAQAYYWHRFFSHQPDLNYDNPAVLEEMLNVMRFWLDLGVDGLRLDAVPYLVEREGTNCENLPETHAVIRRIRRELDAAYTNRVLLAEANQWPADVRPYFGEGDACHMAFHFPLMPRIFMALRLEDRHPITEIMAQTPEIPASCQWGLFLRNHDELTLEMVTDEERDYMYLAYSADPRMRLNVGIRRRLAPLMENNRRRIELMNSLLFSFPGTPIIYYGDEIGMGDNIYLGDRNGVRTPMQWTADRNAGFSRANPARLYSPVIMDPVYGYEAINVEAQQSDPSSLLHWMRNMIALRKLFQVFGRGSLEFLHPENNKVLAYLRKYRGDQILCVANLSRFAQPVELDLGHMAGVVPVEMLGYTEFPAIGKAPYRLTLGPYGFLWFELQGTPEAIEVRAAAEPCPLTVRDWDEVFQERARRSLEAALPEFIGRQHWFRARGGAVETARVADWGWIRLGPAPLAWMVVEATFTGGGNDSFHLPVAISTGEAAARLGQDPAPVLCELHHPAGTGVLHDALADEESCRGLFEAIENNAAIATQSGMLRAFAASRFNGTPGASTGPRAPEPTTPDGAVTAAVLDDRFTLKLLRKLEAGPNPEYEALRFLSESTAFDGVAKFAGAMEYERRGEIATAAILQQYVPHQGDGWSFTREELERYYAQAQDGAPKPSRRSLLELAARPVPAPLREQMGGYLAFAATLGRRTAELHQALASPAQDAAFQPEPLTPADVSRIAHSLRERAVGFFDALKTGMAWLPDELVDTAATALSRRGELLDRFQGLAQTDVRAERIRIHGNYRLENILRVGNDVLIDFAAAPGRPPVERRAKQLALRDVAGMLRSFSRAARAALPKESAHLEPWARHWERWSSAAFLAAYRQAADGAGFVPRSEEGWRALLDALLLDRALEELARELPGGDPALLRAALDGVLAYAE